MSETKEGMSDLLICEPRKGPQPHCIDFMGISDVSGKF